MPLRVDSLEEHRGAAENILARALQPGSVGLRLLPLHWEDSKQSGHWERLTSARAPLLLYICTVYALADKTRFDSACQLFLQYSYSKVKAYAAPLGQLWFDISVAASVGHWTACRDAADLILQHPVQEDDDDFPMLSAVLLARFANGDLEGTRNLANRLLAGVEMGRYIESGWAFMAGPWAYAAVHFANGAYEDANKAILALERAHTDHIADQLRRNGENGQITVSAFDFWDWNGCALQAIAHQFSPHEKRIATSLSDWQWTLRRE